MKIVSVWEYKKENASLAFLKKKKRKFGFVSRLSWFVQSAYYALSVNKRNFRK